ncbi:hypothetical protein Q3G72_011466 [Acer saccharum]|nr:hypothetical protein Q3G72_011466 [Acer saccharum]
MPCVNALHCTTMSLSSCPSSSSLRVRASFDTQQRLSYNPNAPKNPNKALASTAKPPPPPPLSWRSLSQPDWTLRFLTFSSALVKLYACRHLLFPALSIEEYNDRVTTVVRCEAQKSPFDLLVWFVCCRDVLRWGKNVGTSKTRTRRRVGIAVDIAVYNRASSLKKTTRIGFKILEH